MQEWIKETIAYSGFNRIIFILGVVILGLILTRFIRFLISRMVKQYASSINVDPTNYRFLMNAISFMVLMSIVIIIFYFVPELNKLGSSLMASAGILAAIIGFAAQQAFSNIVSGVFIVVFKPFGVGDYIRVGNVNYGEVEDITLRHTVIRNAENRRVIIPNSVISSETILNSSIKDMKVCTHLELSVAYSTNLDYAMGLIQQLALQHPNIIDNRSDSDKSDDIHPVCVRVLELGESSVRLRAYLWAEDSGRAFVMKCDILKSIKETFEENDIETPFPHRKLIIKNNICNS